MTSVNPGMAAVMLGMALWLTGVSRSGAEIVPVYEYHFASKAGNRYITSKDNAFGCDDIIYLFLESSDQSLGNATLETTWRNLESGERHVTSNPFTRRESGTRYWSWGGIEFPAGNAGPLGAITGFLDPVAGREKFIGEWAVLIRVPDRYEIKARIRVLC